MCVEVLRAHGSAGDDEAVVGVLGGRGHVDPRGVDLVHRGHVHEVAVERKLVAVSETMLIKVLGFDHSQHRNAVR